MNTIETIENLKARIIELNDAYRKGDVIVSDLEYDALVDKLAFHLNALLPKAEVNAFFDSLNEGRGKVEHPCVMGSLNKIKAEEINEFSNFITKYTSGFLHVSTKIDGISCRLRYTNGRLTGAYTRGDGYAGQILNRQIKFVKQVPHQIGTVLPNNEYVDIRGELVIYKDDFKKIAHLFKNARNACAGIMNQKTIEKELLKHVSFVSFEIMNVDLPKQETFNILEKNGFTNPYFILYDIKKADINHIVANLKSLVLQDFPYEIDGLVISDVNYISENKYRPDAQVAFKVNDLIGESTVVDIDWRGPSKDGKYIPVAKIEPIELGGSTITYATLHNIDFMQKMNLQIGTIVEIVKSGDIIPKITRVITQPLIPTPITLIDHCVVCNTHLKTDGVDLYCDNQDCSDKEQTAVTNFVRNLGVEYAAKQSLINWGINTFKDLVDFKPDSNSKSQIKFFEQLSVNVFNKTQEELFARLNFRGLGVNSVTKMAEFYGLENLKNKNFNKGFPEGIGQVTIDRFCETSDRNFEILSLLINDSRWTATKQQNKEQQNKEQQMKTVCFTGKIEGMTRAQAASLAEKNGFTQATSVNRDLDVLVCADPSSNSGKMKKAREYGVEIMTSTAFFEKYC